MYSVPTTSTAVDLIFGLIVAVVCVAVPFVAFAASRQTPALARRRAVYAGVWVMAWIGAWVGIAGTGVLLRFDLQPPPFVMVLASIITAAVLVARSATGRAIAHDLPLAALVGFQTFRFPLELVLHRLYTEQALPIQMTFEGLNFDILTGISALVLGLWALRAPLPRWVLWAWNLMGAALLVTIVSVAMMSAPLPIRQFFNEPANTLVTSPLYILLPVVLVLAALIGHILVLMRLIPNLKRT